MYFSRGLTLQEREMITEKQLGNLEDETYRKIEQAISASMLPALEKHGPESILPFVVETALITALATHIAVYHAGTDIDYNHLEHSVCIRLLDEVAELHAKYVKEEKQFQSGPNLKVVT